MSKIDEIQNEIQDLKAKLADAESRLKCSGRLLDSTDNKAAAELYISAKKFRDALIAAAPNVSISAHFMQVSAVGMYMDKGLLISYRGQTEWKLVVDEFGKQILAPVDAVPEKSENQLNVP